MQFSNEYLDLYDKPQTLTQAELQYFCQTVDTVRSALGVQVEITNRDHERAFSGKSREALGVFYTSDPKNPCVDCFITIDNYFIHECYEERYHGELNLSGQSLEEVLCHEIAHMNRFRHGKSHRLITEEYLNRVKAFTEQHSRPLAEMIFQASQRAAAAHKVSHNKTPEQVKE